VLLPNLSRVCARSAGTPRATGRSASRHRSPSDSRHRSPARAGVCLAGLAASVSLLSDHWRAIEAWAPAPAPDALDAPLLKQARGRPRARACPGPSPVRRLAGGAPPRLCPAPPRLCPEFLARPATCSIGWSAERAPAHHAEPHPRRAATVTGKRGCPGRRRRAGRGDAARAAAAQHVAGAPGVRVGAHQLLAARHV